MQIMVCGDFRCTMARKLKIRGLQCGHERGHVTHACEPHAVVNLAGMLGLQLPKRPSHVAADGRHQKACSVLLRDADHLPVSKKLVFRQALAAFSNVQHVDAMNCSSISPTESVIIQKAAAVFMCGARTDCTLASFSSIC